jgi:hypothetical protein
MTSAAESERKAAIDQLATVTATERASAIDQLAAATNAAATQAVTRAEASSRKLIDYAFGRLGILIVFLLVGIPLVMLIYKLIARRIFGP